MDNSNESLLSYELKLYKQICEEENKYRNDYSDSVFRTTTIIISLFAAFIWLILKFANNHRIQNFFSAFVNVVLLLICFIILGMIVIYFFKILYGYNDSRLSPEDLSNLIKEYKTQTSDEEKIITALEKSLLISYKDAAINNYIENQKRVKMFTYVYRLILIDIIFISITFLIEIF